MKRLFFTVSIVMMLTLFAQVSVASPVGPIAAIINLDPDTINLESNGKWLTAYIELP